MKTRAVDRPVAYWSGELLDQTRLEYEAAKTHGVWRAVALVAIVAIVGAFAVAVGPAIGSGGGAAKGLPAWVVIALVAVGVAVVALGIFLAQRRR
jgi:hypothetical protein